MIIQSYKNLERHLYHKGSETNYFVIRNIERNLFLNKEDKMLMSMIYVQCTQLLILHSDNSYYFSKRKKCL